MDGGKSTTVSVRSSKAASGKRKAGEAIAEAHREEAAAREGKKSKKSGKKSR